MQKEEQNYLFLMRRSLTKKERLNGKNDIQRIFSEGKRVSVPGIKLIYLKNQLNYNRIIIIPRKKYGISVERNKIKRWMRDIYRNLKNDIKHGYDLTFIVFPGDYNYERRSRQAQILLKQAGLYFDN